jgi:hypothetical protein
MHIARTFTLTCLAALAIAGLTANTASADIIGFNDLKGWDYTAGDSGTPANLPTPDTLHFSTGNGQRRSVFYKEPQSITEFTASFTYKATNFNASLVGQGITFCVQNDPAGSKALGGKGIGLGYASWVSNPQSIVKSSAVAIFGDTGPGLTYNGLWTNGTVGGGNQSISPANAFDFRDLNVVVSYEGSIMSVTIDDPVIPGGAEYVRNFVVGDLSAIVGGNTAFVGFTTGTGDNFGNGGANQFISNFTFTAVPTPATGAVLMLAGLIGSRRRR